MSGGFSGPIWEGIYPDFDSVRKSGEGFAGQRWTDAAKTAARSVSTDGAVSTSRSLLPVVAALAPARDNVLRILDFGGGPGVTFAAVRSAVQGRPLDFHVVENANICEIGRAAFADNREVNFHESLPALPARFDIVHLGSSIQYVDDWKQLIRRLAGYEPNILLFTELMAGDIPTFASAQNYYGSRIPMWFLNMQDFTKFLADLGFRLGFREAFRGTYLGVEQPCPQENFPAEYRIGYASHALFMK